MFPEDKILFPPRERLREKGLVRNSVNHESQNPDILNRLYHGHEIKSGPKSSKYLSRGQQIKKQYNLVLCNLRRATEDYHIILGQNMAFNPKNTNLVKNSFNMSLLGLCNLWRATRGSNFTTPLTLEF